MDLSNVSFDGLYTAVKRMGAELTDFNINLDMGDVDPIDIGLAEGCEVSLGDVEYENGLLGYEGRQVLLYIQDQGGKISDVIQQGETGRKYHVADCSTLETMRELNRFERYVVTNDLSPDFFVSGKDWDTKEYVEGKAQLKVCKNCLKKLNYQGYDVGGQKRAVFSAFDLKEFFSTYSSFFSHIPSRFAVPAARDKYTDDWESISKKYRTSQNFICEGEGCELDLSNHPKLLHAHHKDGVKTNNQHANLMALCVACHSAQPYHGHMFVSHKDRRMIVRLRREQGKLGTNSWDRVIEVADPGVRGLVLMCKQQRLPVPVVGHEIRVSANNVLTELELAWPNQRVGIAIDTADVSGAQSEGWNIWKVVDALDQFDALVDALATQIN